MYYYGKNTHELLDQELKDNPSVKKSFILALILVASFLCPFDIDTFIFFVAVMHKMHLSIATAVRSNPEPQQIFESE